MTKYKNKGKAFKASPNLIAENSTGAFLKEKQAVSNFNYVEISERNELETCYRTSNQSKNPVAKRRGRLQEIKWSLSEIAKLYELHDQLGNKWKEIARYFPDRSDNNIKNHFFSRLRLSLRQLNKIIFKLFGPKKQIKNHTLYKITSICQLKFKDNPSERQDLIQEARTLKKRILKFIQAQPLDQLAVSLWENIISFSNKTSHTKGKTELSDQFQSQDDSTHLNNRELEYANNRKTETQQPIQAVPIDKNALRSINEDDFVMTRNLTPNQKIFLNIPPQLAVEKTEEEYIVKPAILVPENLFLSPIHSVEDSVFNLNLSDQSYFSQNQNLSFYTDFLNQQRPQFQGV